MEQELFKLREPLQNLLVHAGKEPELVYYYCSIPTFSNIIKNRELWLTSTVDMNDYLELEWAAGVLRQILKERQRQYPEVVSSFLGCFIPDSFLCCFSAGRDALSQWRAYADDGKGFAIGFDTSEFKTLARSRIDCLDEGLIEFVPVIYDQKLQWEAIENVFASVCAYGKKFGPNSIAGIRDQISLILRCLYISLKNPAFSEEQEWRLAKREYVRDCYPMQINNFIITERDYRSAKNSISPFHKFLFDDNFVREVVIGPKNTSQTYLIDDFLNTNNHTNVLVSKSSASYR